MATTLVSGVGVVVVGVATSYVALFQVVGLVVPSEALAPRGLLGGLLRMVVLLRVIDVVASPCPGSLGSPGSF